LIDLLLSFSLLIFQVRHLHVELEKTQAEAKLMCQHTMSYINDVVETMGNALLGRVYDLELKHHKEFDHYVNKFNLI